MDLNYELLLFFVYRKIIKRKDVEPIAEACKKLQLPVETYLIAKEYCTEVTALEAMADFFCMPCSELDMLDIDEDLFNQFGFEFMKKHKVVPICRNKKGVLLLAVGRPLDCNAISAIASRFICPFDFVLVPTVQIDRHIDSIMAVISTSTALEDLNAEKDKELAKINNSGEFSGVGKEDDVINTSAVRLVDSIIREAIPYRASDIHIEPFEKVVKVRYRRRLAAACRVPHRKLHGNLRSYKDYFRHQHCREAYSAGRTYKHERRRQGIRLPCVQFAYSLRGKVRYPYSR